MKVRTEPGVCGARRIQVTGLASDRSTRDGGTVSHVLRVDEARYRFRLVQCGSPHGLQGMAGVAGLVAFQRQVSVHVQHLSKLLLGIQC